MDTSKLKKLIEIVRASGISELEISDNDEKIRIVNAPAQSNIPVQTYMAAPQPQYAVPPAAAASVEAPAPSSPSAPVADNRKLIRSPMVGTFYQASSPGAKPLAEVGTKVKRGQTVCIIEAMKLMNEIEAECDGVIKEVLVTNEQPVEYGEALFVIE